MPSPREALVRTAVNRYLDAFNSQDQTAVRAVWPSAPDLGRAFKESQTMQFKDCKVSLNDARAKATCDGTVRYVPRAGTSTVRVESRQWEFELRETKDAAWLIDTSRAR
jgi:hypothetical protein